MPSVNFHYADISPVSLKGKKAIKESVVKLFELEGKKMERINYIFCSDLFLLNLNRSFLKHNFLTDIITFDLSEGFDIIGEIYISVERVKDNAVTHNATFFRELIRVVYHGALHLCGYTDKKKSEITVMRGKEEYYLRLFEENTT